MPFLLKDNTSFQASTGAKLLGPLGYGAIQLSISSLLGVLIAKSLPKGKILGLAFVGLATSYQLYKIASTFFNPQKTLDLTNDTALKLNALPPSDIMKSSTFMLADYLVDGTGIDGAFYSMILPLYIEALHKITTDDAVTAKHCLQGLYHYDQYFDRLGFFNKLIIEDLIQHVLNLKPGQSTLLDFSSLSLRAPHTMIGSIQRKDESTFIVRLHNGGIGTHFHYKRVDPTTGNKIIQTTLEIDNVNESNISPFIKAIALQNAYRLSNRVKGIYDSLKILQGRLSPASEDARFWSRAQMGGSCTGYAIKCYLKSTLSPETFIEFEHKLLTLSTHCLRTIYNHGLWRPDYYQHVIYEELRQKQLRLGLETPDSFDPFQLVTTKDPSNLLAEKSISFIKTQIGQGFILPNWGALDTYEYRRVTNLNFFNQIIASFDVLGSLENEKGLLEQVLQAKQKAKEELIKFNQAIERTILSEADRATLDACVSSLISGFEKPHLMASGLYYSVTNHHAFNLWSMFKILFPYMPYKISSQEALQLWDSLKFLMGGDLTTTRNLLEKIFPVIEAKQSISFEEARDYEYILIYALEMQAPLKLEALDLSAGFVYMLYKLHDKILPERTGTYNLLSTSTYLSTFLERYRDYRVDREFPTSPWKRAIFDLHMANPNYTPSELELPKECRAMNILGFFSKAPSSSTEIPNLGEKPMRPRIKE